VAETREERLERLFAETAALPPEERHAFLEETCRADPSLRAELASLLADAGEAEAWLDRVVGPGMARAAEVLTDPWEGNEQRAVDPLVGEAVGRFQILERLGGGGMGVVYKARDARLDRLVALKFLHLHQSADPRARARLMSEARAVSALDHPNLAVVHEIGEHRGQLFIAMAFYEGETLKKKLAHGPLPVREALDYVVQIAEGLQRAHEAGIVHRDIKPANVLVTDRGQVKVVDFGIAHVPGENVTQTGMTVGTVAYMSPEQASGQTADQRTDLWSLGVLLYEMLAGERPFQGENVLATLDAIRHGEPKSLASLSPGIPEALVGVLRRLLQKDPEARTRDAAELLTDLQGLREPAALDLRSAERSPRTSGTGRRRVIGAAIVLVVGTLGVVLWEQASGPQNASTPKGSGAPAEPAWLAVLPLENYSRDPEQEDFADGMTEELITTLAKIEGLRVIAHRSVRQFKSSDTSVPEIAVSLGVRYVVDGSVLQEGDRVRITANLIDAETGTPIWGERFERERRDVMGLQREVALAIARQIEITLTPQDLTRLEAAAPVDPEAFDLYVKGTQARYENTAGTLEEAADYFERAIARDSGYAPAYAGLAWVLAFSAPDSSRARWLARKAVELDPNLADAHVALGLIRELDDWDWAGSEEALRRAIRVSPGHAEAHHELSMLLMRQSRFDEALREAREALYLAPMSARFEFAIGWVQLVSGRVEEALQAAAKARALDADFPWAYWLAGRAHEQLGQYEEAVEAFERGSRPGAVSPGVLGHLYAVSGRKEEALNVLEGLKVRRKDDGEWAIDIATIYAGLGDVEQALDWLARAVEEGGWLVDLGIDPRLRSLHGEPRFRALLDKMGLDP